MLVRFVPAAVLASFAFLSNAVAQGCPANALGTSRVIAIDPSEHRRLGYIQYGETLPLHDHEVVLTFDDGPIPPYTAKVLDALAAECVKATFFVVGQQAQAHPDLVQREYREGHTIATHSEHHPHLNHMPVDAATKDIADGIASAGKALGNPNAVAPFFRFPYLDPTRATEESAFKMGLTIWSADLHGSDWNLVGPEYVVSTTISRLERRRKGIVLLHDIHQRTALALPMMLRELKARGFHIVQAVPADSTHPKTQAKPVEWMVTN
jgi:peptidoglycan/xylan/chitin deacetylase (PgdA/CDA1 family)